jgi:Tol biopolymer transport system component
MFAMENGCLFAHRREAESVFRTEPGHIDGNRNSMEMHRLKRAAGGGIAHVIKLAPVLAITSLFFMLSCVREFDNNRLVFARTVNGSYYNLFVIDDDGKNEKQITSGNWIDYPHSWSSDGGKILFSSDRTGNWDIYSIDPDGSNLKQLTDNVANDFGSSWSPNGKKIVFFSNRSGFCELYLMDADGGNVTQLTSLGVDVDEMDPSWSPDGSRIVFTSMYNGYRNLFIINSDGSSTVPTSITNNTNASYRYWWPTWTPDGTKIFCVQSVSRYDVYVINLDGSSQGVLTGELAATAGNLRPSVSPDGEEIIFHCDYAGTGVCNIYKANIDGTGLSNITKSGINEVYPCYFGKPR